MFPLHTRRRSEPRHWLYVQHTQSLAVEVHSAQPPHILAAYDETVGCTRLNPRWIYVSRIRIGGKGNRIDQQKENRNYPFHA
jgi:hypothetical protein